MKILFAGFGNVGKNVASRLLDRELSQSLPSKAVAIVDSRGAAICQDGLNLADAIAWKESCGSISEWNGYGVPDATTTDILDEVSPDLLIETTPTNIESGEPGLSNIVSALSRGIDVITTNKGPIALSLDRLTELAEKNSCSLSFGGTVGGGTPVLDFARDQLKSEKILSIRGVLNSTSNYILWKMAKDEVDLKDALQEAKSHGITETDSRYDIGGIDTACKLVILANSIMDYGVSLRNVTIQGIQNVSLNDVLEAERANKAVRLVGRIEDEERVSPELIDKTDSLYVEKDNNSICFSTEYNNYTLIGKGAGGKETANAVIRDLVNIYQVEQSRGQTISRLSVLSAR